MRYGVISDVHANLQALETALDFLQEQRVDRIVCLGDLVGYGPQPNEVVARIAELSIPTVVGNHDLVASGLDPLERAGPTARLTLAWTQSELTEESGAFLRSLPLSLRLEGDVLAAHGSINDPWHYVRRVPDALEQLRQAPSDLDLLLLGHTHRQMAIDTDSGKVAMSGWVLARRARRLPLGDVVFVNPGALGQSREPRPLARCAIADLAKREVHLYALRYPHSLCEEELRKRRLPKKWCHMRPTPKKVVRQVLRDAEDRRYHLDWKHGPSDIT